MLAIISASINGGNMIYKIYEGALVSIVAVMVVLLMSGKAHADNDDLAFDFVSAESSVLIAVDECVERGIYTGNQGDSVKSDDLIHEYNIDNFDNIGDFCQQVYDELYPNEYEANKIIRGIVK